MVLAALMVGLMGCNDRSGESVTATRAPRAPASSPAVVFAKTTFAHGNAIVTDRGLEVHLTTAPIE